MSAHLILTLLLLAAAMAAFLANRPRVDVVAIIAIVAFPLLGILSTEQTLAGFSDPSVLLIAAFFIIGEGLVRTGIAYSVGDWLVRKAGNSETRLLVLLMLAVAGLGAFMSSTGVVAIFIPVVLSVAARMKISPSRLLMPLSFAGLMSGMLTLVATPPNLMVNSELQKGGETGFSFFSFTPIGLIILAAGTFYMLVVRRWLGADQQADPPAYQRHTLQDFITDYRLQGRDQRLRIRPGSSLTGHPLGELQLRASYGANILGVERHQHLRQKVLSATPDLVFEAGDILLVDFTRSEENLPDFCHDRQLDILPFQGSYFTDQSKSIGMTEVLLPPDSSLTGRTVLEIGFRSRFHLNVIGLRRDGQAVEGELLDEKLKAGDTLLVAGAWKAIRQLQQHVNDFLVLNLPVEMDLVAPALRRAPFAIFTLLVTIALMVSGLIPNILAALIGCLLLGAFRCIDLNSTYRSIHWQSLVLIVGMLPFATALKETGGIDLAVSALLNLSGDGSPRLLIAGLFATTALVGLFISNTATAVLMAPLALTIAERLSLSPYPFVMTVAIAASAAFMTPVSSPVNTLVLAPGGYRFSDFLKIGVPFTFIVLLICVIMIPLLFPFQAP